MNFGCTTQILSSSVMLQWIQGLNLTLNGSYSIKSLPAESKNIIKIEDISEYLYAKGTSSSAIGKLVAAIDDFQMIAKWYQTVGDISEFETESYLIIPMLRALDRHHKNGY